MPDQDTPEGALKLFFDAMFVYMDPSTRDSGRQMLASIMHAEEGWDRLPSNQTFVSRLRDASYHHIFRSFAKGSSPQNGYAMDVDDYELCITSQKPEGDYLRVMLRSSGADSSRATWVKQYADGKWYVINNAGVYAGVRAPEI